MSVPTANVLISQDKDSISKVLQKLGSGVPITNLAGQFSREDATRSGGLLPSPRFPTSRRGYALGVRPHLSRRLGERCDGDGR